MSDNLYEVLGITADATTRAIKLAYKKLAMVHHPDRGGNAETFKKISAAYTIIGDPIKRKEYDASVSGKPSDSDYTNELFREFRYNYINTFVLYNESLHRYMQAGMEGGFHDSEIVRMSRRRFTLLDVIVTDDYISYVLHIVRGNCIKENPFFLLIIWWAKVRRFLEKFGIRY